MPRIISLLASATEMVCALELEDQLVGRSHECDYPAFVRKLPICTEPNFDVSGSSKDIDQNVKSQLEHSRPLYKIDADQIRRLKPDLIITQSHCEVCAVNQKGIEAVLKPGPDGKPQIVSLVPNGLADVWTGMKEIGMALDVPEKADKAIARLKAQMETVVQKTKTFSQKPSVACLEWIDPLMAAGNWVPELVQMAGGINLFGIAKEHSPWMSWPELIQKKPHFILVMPCGFDIRRTRKEMWALTEKPEWEQLEAVANNRVILLDGNQYFNRPGPRLVDSLEMLAEIFYPEEFDFGHRNVGWEYFSVSV